MDLDAKIAVITGASRGIGLAVAGDFLRRGATVIGTGRSQSSGNDAFERLAGDGQRAMFLELDIRDEQRVRSATAKVLERYGRIDVLVNNAAIQREAMLADATVADFRAIVDTNLMGTFLMTREVLPAMVERGGGVIVNMSSVLGLVADSVLPIYAATKAGIIALTKATAVGYARFGIRANTVCPGDVDTELNRQYFASHSDPTYRSRVEAEYPAGRFASPDEIARVVSFLASDEATFVNGTCVVVDGGITARLYQGPSS